MTDITKTLAERGARYGEFIENAGIAQALKQIMREGESWEKLDCDQREALDMIAAKVSRIVTGDPGYVDNWHDIIGYTRLVEDRLVKEQLRKSDAPTAPAEKPAAASMPFEKEIREVLKDLGLSADRVIVHTFQPRSGQA